MRSNWTVKRSGWRTSSANKDGRTRFCQWTSWHGDCQEGELGGLLPPSIPSTHHRCAGTRAASVKQRLSHRLPVGMNLWHTEAVQYPLLTSTLGVGGQKGVLQFVVVFVNHVLVLFVCSNHDFGKPKH